MKAVNLRVEYLENPIGLGIRNPRFFWNCENGKKQTAYQIICKNEDKLVWDSGKVKSSDMTHILYQGKELSSKDRIVWHIRLWDEADKEGEFSKGTFEMGLLVDEDWKAKWIRGDYKCKKNVRRPVDCFRKQFAVEKEIGKARLYITACGIYEAKLNGEKAGSFCLAPGSTDYRKRIQYQTIDVTSALRQGLNTLEIQLADGWYRGSVGAYGLLNTYGKETKLLYQLELTFADGGREIVLSDDSTEWSCDGPIRFADLKDGEIYDAACLPSYRGKAKNASSPKGKLTASDNVIPEMHEVFSPKLIMTAAGKQVLDFGQNIAGFVSFTVKGKKGEKVFLRLGEKLDKDGEFTQSNFQLDKPAEDVGLLKEMGVACGKSAKVAKRIQKTPLQEITFYCSGNKDAYCTTFAVFGFRYALIETDVNVRAEDFYAIAVYSSMEQTGEFSCSNEKINQLYRNTVWSMKGNFLDVPTDCPQRERLGWTGDAQIFFNTGAYMMNVAPFFRKWLRDIKDAQRRNGKLPSVVPYSRPSVMYDTSGASTGWEDAIILVPYRFWKRYGDRRILEECYPMMRSYVDFMLKNTGHKDKKEKKEDPYNKYVYEKGFHFGEWLEPEEYVEKIEASGNPLGKLHPEEATAYLHLDMVCMKEIAEELGFAGDVRLFDEYAEGTVKAYDRNSLTPVPDTDRQAKLVRPLALGLVPEEKEKGVSDRLFQAVINRNYRIATGFLSTPFVLPVLTKYGRPDLAYKMLENELAPGWLYEVNSGATTIWEDWEGQFSLNHYSPGAVCEWMFDTILGIRVDGKRHFTIAPIPGGSLTKAKGSYCSIYGCVKSGWKKDGISTKYQLEIPANTSATIVIGGKTKELPAGSYQFREDEFTEGK